MLPPACPKVGVLVVPGQTVCELRSSAIHAASSASFYVPGSVVSICDSPAFSKAAEDERVDSNPDGLGCLRGLRSAFLFEAGMVLLGYGIWHLWHLAH
jgi:hypothetical protein